MYLLNNFAVADVAFISRYATEMNDAGYLPARRDHELYELYAEVVDRFRLEMVDMTCDIQTGLEAIADAISGLSFQGGGCGGNAVSDCIADLPTEDILGPEGESEGNPSTDPPPDGFDTWDEYFLYKCQAAHFIHNYIGKYLRAAKGFDLIFLGANLVVPVIAGLAGILPAALTPAGFVILVGSILAVAALSLTAWFFMDEAIDWWDANEDAIVCSLYNSGNSVEAVSAVSNAIEDAIQAIVSWGTLSDVAGEISDLLGAGFGQLAGNGLVEPLFKTVISVVQFSDDCSMCSEEEEVALKTNTATPYDLLQVGDGYTSPCHGAYGFEASDACGNTFFLLTPAADLGSLVLSYEIKSEDAGSLNFAVYRVSDETFITTWTTRQGTSAWVPWEDSAGGSLDEGVQYRLQLTPSPNDSIRARKILLVGTVV